MPKPGERDCLDSSVCSGFCGHLVTTSIGEADVTQHRIDVVRGHPGHRGFYIICSYNVVTKMSKQTRQCTPGIVVIFHEQYTQRFGCLAAEAMVNADRCSSLWLSVQRNLERRTETSATAFRFNSAVVEIDETFGNRESETKSAKLPAYRRISLFKWLKQRSQPLRLNSNPCVFNFEMKTSIFVVKRADA